MDEIARLLWPYVKKVWADPELRKEAINNCKDALEKNRCNAKSNRQRQSQKSNQVQDEETDSGSGKKGNYLIFLPINACFQKSRENEEKLSLFFLFNYESIKNCNNKPCYMCVTIFLL